MPRRIKFLAPAAKKSVKSPYGNTIPTFNGVLPELASHMKGSKVKSGYLLEKKLAKAKPVPHSKF